MYVGGKGAYDFYYILWFGVVAGVVYYVRKQAKATQDQTLVTEDFKRFQRSYVVIFLLLTAADWMQGPYLYALYDSYGHSKHIIGRLFILGFGSAAVCSTFVGSLADKYGRKKLCQVHCALLIMSLLTKHSSSFFILGLGRVLGGASASILVSSFESWMVHQHLFLSYPDHWMRGTFEVVASGKNREEKTAREKKDHARTLPMTYFITCIRTYIHSTGVVAMVSGLVATFIFSHFGHVAPFDLAIVLAALGLMLLTRAWPENYGDSDISVLQTLENSYESIKGDPVIMLLGLSQALFEAGMYIFVVMWTPTLDETSTTPVSHGWVFSSFMLCIILGGTLYKQYLAFGGTVEKLMLFACAVGSIALAIPCVVQEHTLQLVSFLVFETCVGVFWPSASSLRSMYFPEETRASVMIRQLAISSVFVATGVIITTVVFLIVDRCRHGPSGNPPCTTECADNTRPRSDGAGLAQFHIRYFIKITSGETDVIEELGMVDENLSNVGLPIPLSNEEAAAAAASPQTSGVNSHEVEMISADSADAPSSNSSSSKKYRRNIGGGNSNSLKLTEIVTEKEEAEEGKTADAKRGTSGYS
eukprot:jgi/Bigna1/66187/fgenesh1_pg.1_\